MWAYGHNKRYVHPFHIQKPSCNRNLAVREHRVLYKCPLSHVNISKSQGPYLVLTVNGWLVQGSDVGLLLLCVAVALSVLNMHEGHHTHTIGLMKSFLFHREPTEWICLSDLYLCSIVAVNGICVSWALWR